MDAIGKFGEHSRSNFTSKEQRQHQFNQRDSLSEFRFWNQVTIPTKKKNKKLKELSIEAFKSIISILL